MLLDDIVRDEIIRDGMHVPQSMSQADCGKLVPSANGCHRQRFGIGVSHVTNF